MPGGAGKDIPGGASGIAPGGGIGRPDSSFQSVLLQKTVLSSQLPPAPHSASPVQGSPSVDDASGPDVMHTASGKRPSANDAVDCRS